MLKFRDEDDRNRYRQELLMQLYYAGMTGMKPDQLNRGQTSTLWPKSQIDDVSSELQALEESSLVKWVPDAITRTVRRWKLHEAGRVALVEARLLPP